MKETTIETLERILATSTQAQGDESGQLWKLLQVSATEIGMISRPVGFGEEELPVEFCIAPGDKDVEWQYILTYVALAVLRDVLFQRIWMDLPELFTCCVYAPDDHRNWMWLGDDTVVIDIASWKDRDEFIARLSKECGEEVVTGDYIVRHVRFAFYPTSESRKEDRGDVRFPEYSKKYGNPSISVVPPVISPDHRSEAQRTAELKVLPKYKWLIRLEPGDYGYDLVMSNRKQLGNHVRKLGNALVVYGTGCPLEYLPVDDSTNILAVVALVAITLGIEVPERVQRKLRLPKFYAPWHEIQQSGEGC